MVVWAAITAKYGGGLMWIATVAILCHVFYNVECGRYALYTGEPVFMGFMRTRPGPGFWVVVALLLSLGALIPGLSTNAAVLGSVPKLALADDQISRHALASGFRRRKPGAIARPLMFWDRA